MLDIDWDKIDWETNEHELIKVLNAENTLVFFVGYGEWEKGSWSSHLGTQGDSETQNSNKRLASSIISNNEETLYHDGRKVVGMTIETLNNKITFVFYM